MMELFDQKHQEQATKLKVLLRKYPELYRRIPDKLDQYAEELRKLANVLRAIP
jgi:hypothetical protein